MNNQLNEFIIIDVPTNSSNFKLFKPGTRNAEH